MYIIADYLTNMLSKDYRVKCKSAHHLIIYNCEEEEYILVIKNKHNFDFIIGGNRILRVYTIPTTNYHEAVDWLDETLEDIFNEYDEAVENG